MKIKFTEAIKLAINDETWGEEFTQSFKQNEEKEILSVEMSNPEMPKSEYFNIHFARKVIAYCVHKSAFTHYLN